MRDSTQYLIIGAGPCGLGAAYRLKELGINNYRIIEANPWVGGLAASFIDQQGFTWDIGGHVQFSHYDYFDQAMDRALGADGYFLHDREAWVWMQESFIPYPLQNNVHKLPKALALECIKGLLATKNNETRKPTNFLEFSELSFGPGLMSAFVVPYNKKVWAYPLEEMSCKWVGERVATVNIDRIIENLIFDKEEKSWGPNNRFRFPKKGGTGAIWQGIADKVGRDKIHCGLRVETIDAKKRLAKLSDGSELSYEQLLTTAPLERTARQVETFPAGLSTLASGLKFSSSNIVGIGLKGQPKDELSKKCWLYFPEDNCPFYRVTIFSNYSPANVPDSSCQYSLMAEISESPRKPVNHATLIEDTIQGMLNTGLIESRKDIISTWSYRAEHGYPTPSIERDEIVRSVVTRLEDFGIYSRGRFGAWKYEVSNQDHTFMQGVEWANKITGNGIETTLTI